MTQRSQLWRGLAVIIWAHFLSLSFYSAAQADNHQCANEDLKAGFIVSLTEHVEIFPNGSSEARDYSAEINDYSDDSEKRYICAGDTIRTGVNSNAVISIVNQDEPGNRDMQVTIESNSVFKVSERKSQETGTPANEPPVRKASFAETLDYCLKNLENAWLFLEQGAIHIFTKEPQNLNINTPYMNASVEGTEFTVTVGKEHEVKGQTNIPAESTLVAVGEGKVNVCNVFSTQDLIVRAGESAFATEGTPPVKTIVKPEDAVHWALYYPRLNPDRTDEKYTQAIEAYDLLVEGRIEEAQDKLQGLTDDFAQALEVTIDVTQNRKEEALSNANVALIDNPDSAPLLLAKSYAQQANFDLKGALESVEKASIEDPESIIILTRLAELQQINGNTKEALISAKRAVEQDDQISRTHTVLGFIKLSLFEIDEAKALFNKAISIDEYDPLPRLGLGLSLIRKNKLQAGLDSMAEAVILDPLNSILRSYFGKTYAELNQSEQAIEQYRLAQQFDPKDPTPYFYQSAQMLSENKPVQALYSVQDSILRNKNRSVYRSLFQLDSDLASRSASRSDIYTELGYDHLSVNESANSVLHDYFNYSAHRSLAFANFQRPRHEVARVSELFISQLLQSINLNPVQSSLTDSRLAGAINIAPLESSLNEYSSYFTREKNEYRFGAVYGSNSTENAEFILSGLNDTYSYALSGTYFSTDGYFENNDEQEKSAGFFFQNEIDNQSNIQFEYRHIDSDTGDTFIGFDSTLFDDDLRLEEKIDSFRLGYQYKQAVDNRYLASIRYEDAEFDLRNYSFLDVEGFQVDVDNIQQEQGYLAELQNIRRFFEFGDSVKIDSILGVGYFSADREDTEIQNGFSLTDETNPLHRNVYFYLNSNYRHHKLGDFRITTGASYDKIEDFVINQSEFNPKFGLIWRSLGEYDYTTIRLASFNTTRRALLANQTLEPTTLAGFTQFFDDDEATQASGYAAAVDKEFSRGFGMSIEMTKRNLSVPVIYFDEDFNEFLVDVGDISEHDVGVEFRWAGSLKHFGELSLVPSFRREVFDRELFFELEEQIEDMDTRTLAIDFNYFHPSGYRFSLTPRYIEQSGRFLDVYTFESYDGDDEFFVMDMEIGKRLENGLVSLELKNIFDNDFNYQDIDPFNTRISPERAVFLKLNFKF